MTKHVNWQFTSVPSIYARSIILKNKCSIASETSKLEEIVWSGVLGGNGSGFLWRRFKYFEVLVQMLVEL